jgi:phenylalanyl-tRNA synthetase beta chain
MKLPLAWLMDYLPPEAPNAFADACSRWDLEPGRGDDQSLAKLMTFAGFNCDGIEGSGENAALVLDVLSNRADCQCVLGLAREVTAIIRVPLKLPPFDIAQYERGEPAQTLAKVRIEEPDLCPRYTARIIRGVKVGESPKWLKDRLTAMGLTPRNNIVDVTNFVLFELNQPLHAFDLNGLAGRVIVVRRAMDKEPF